MTQMPLLDGAPFAASPDRYEAMPYRRSGRSGLKLPALSLGFWHNFGDAAPGDTQRAIVRRAPRRRSCARSPARAPAALARCGRSVDRAWPRIDRARPRMVRRPGVASGSSTGDLIRLHRSIRRVVTGHQVARRALRQRPAQEPRPPPAAAVKTETAPEGAASLLSR